MSNIFDAYLIAQALGWDWNIWTMILINGFELLLMICFGVFILIAGVWLDKKLKYGS